MAYTGKKPIDHTDVTQSQSMTVTDDLTVDTDTLHVDSTNNRVGIGTSSPSYELDVSSVITTSKTTLVRLNGNYVAGNLSHGIGFSINGNPASAGVYVTEANGFGSNLVFTTSPDFDAVTPTNTERLRILSSGGITFNGDTAAANALDDYEEGTWTPSLYAIGSRTGTWESTLTGTYTKIGRLVHVNLRISGTSMGFTANGGYSAYSGLPFAVVEDQAGAWASGSISSHQAGIVYGATNEILWLYAPQTTSSTTNGITATLTYYTS